MWKTPSYTIILGTEGAFFCIICVQGPMLIWKLALFSVIFHSSFTSRLQIITYISPCKVQTLATWLQCTVRTGICYKHRHWFILCSEINTASIKYLKCSMVIIYGTSSTSQWFAQRSTIQVFESNNWVPVSFKCTVKSCDGMMTKPKCS